MKVALKSRSKVRACAAQSSAAIANNRLDPAFEPGDTA